MTPALRTALAAVCGLAAGPAPAADAPANVSYYRDVRPVFVQHCQGCHQPAKALGGYLMLNHADLLKEGDRGERGVVPGKPDESLLVKLVTPHGGKPAEMPKGRDPLTEAQVNLVRRWVAEGAADDTPPAARETLYDEDHPPAYPAPPVVTALAYSPDGNLLAVCGYHEVVLHKGDGTGLAARLVGISERIQSLAFSPDGQFLAAAGGSPGRFGELQVWDVASKKLRLSLSVGYDTLSGASWSPDGKLVAFGCNDNTVRAVEFPSGKQVLYQGAHGDWVLDTVFSVDGAHLVSVSRDRSMKLTEVATQRFIDNVTSITPGALKGGLAAVARRPLKERTTTKALIDDSGITAERVYDELLTGGSDGVPRLYRMHRVTKRVIGDDANKLRQYEAMPGRIYALAFAADGERFAAGSSLDGKGEVRVYSAGDGKVLATMEGVTAGVFAVAYRPDGKFVASAGFDGQVRLHDAQTGKLATAFVPVPVGGK